MVIRKFPEVEKADEYGLLAIGGDLEVDSLLLAYRSGIFPWPFSTEFPAWFAPETRALLFLKDFKISKSMQKERRKNSFTFKVDSCYEAVVRECAADTNRKRKNGTWINENIISAYINFHLAGYSHSIECFNQAKLAGGLYGVSIGGMFAGESMFYREPNASKLSLWFLVEHLLSKGVEWIDCQVQSDFLESLGVKEVPRQQFMELLGEALASNIKLF